MKIAKTLALALALIVPFAAVGARPADAAAAVSVGVFYNSLAPYGDWHVSADFGYVWRPTAVYAGWRPYHDGRWVNTNVGWTFVGNDAWGWATYHYGRWYFDPYYGWVWVPGYEWGPAWVSFHEGPGYIGWAPLSPYVSFGVGIYGGGYRSHYIDPRGYNFVESRHFLSPTVGRWVQPIHRNATLVRNVRDVSRFERVGGMMVNRGLAVDRVERATRSRVRTFQLADHPGGGRALRSEIRGEQLAVYRPKVEKRSTDRPAKVKEGRPAKFDDGKGRSSVERRESPSREATPRATTSQRPEERARPTTPTTRGSAPVAKPVKPATSSRDEKRVATPPSRSSASTVTRKPAAAPQPERKVSKPAPERKVSAPQQSSKVSKPAPERKVTTPKQPSKVSKPAPERKVSPPTRERTVAPPPQRKESAREQQKVQSAPKAQDPKSAQVRSKSAAEEKSDKAREGSRGKTTAKKKPSEKRKPPLVG